MIPSAMAMSFGWAGMSTLRIPFNRRPSTAVMHQDSDIAKWIEVASHVLAGSGKDPKPLQPISPQAPSRRDPTVPDSVNPDTQLLAKRQTRSVFGGVRQLLVAGTGPAV
jgi:hypothetical protein